jgi:hypothetical protein
MNIMIDETNEVNTSQVVDLCEVKRARVADEGERRDMEISAVAFALITFLEGQGELSRGFSDTERLRVLLMALSAVTLRTPYSGRSAMQQFANYLGAQAAVRAKELPAGFAEWFLRDVKVDETADIECWADRGK